MGKKLTNPKRQQGSQESNSLAVLISGGLDSAILLGEVVRDHPAVYPLYIRCGLFYEGVELRFLRRYLRALRGPVLQPLTVLSSPVGDLYGQHWSIIGQNVPARGTPDQAVFLPGRNILLLAKAMLWCHLHGVPAVALGSLQTNPFPDATPSFFADLQNLVNRAVEGNVAIRLPFAGVGKTEVMHRGRDLPLEYTFSCIDPQDGRHCGTCNKCDERRQAFAGAGMKDPTAYFQS
jgi:7-cyano-7-deazaguanine synthase